MLLLKSQYSLLNLCIVIKEVAPENIICTAILLISHYSADMPLFCDLVYNIFIPEGIPVESCYNKVHLDTILQIAQHR